MRATDAWAIEDQGVPSLGLKRGLGDDMVVAPYAAAMALKNLGVRNIVAKAATTLHGRILERVGATTVVFPEHDMGHRVAHLLGGRMIDWLQLDEQFALVETVVCAIDRSPAGENPLADVRLEVRAVLTKAELDAARTEADA